MIDLRKRGEVENGAGAEEKTYPCVTVEAKQELDGRSVGGRSG